MTAVETRGAASQFSVKNVIFAVVPLAAVVLLVFAWIYNQTPPPVDFFGSMRQALVQPTELAEGLTDADGDLVADPAAEAEWLDPETLHFEVLGSNLEREQEQWADFLVRLHAVTGKPVTLTVRPETKGRPGEVLPPAMQQARDLKEGKTHLAALNTGSVSLSVNVGGAVPFCVMADSDGKFGYEMEIIVPAKSPVQEVAELKQLKGDRKVLFGSVYSHSGFKAPLTLLRKEFNLQPERDYLPVFVTGQEQAIKDIAAGKGDASPVASDFLKRMIDSSDIQAAEVRSIYKSKSFPPACFAYAHQLKPEIADKIKTAFLEFDWKDTSLEKAYAAAQQTKFAPISYKDDWSGVRELEADIAAVLKGSPSR